MEINARPIDDMTIRFDRSLKSGEERVAVRLREHPGKRMKLNAPEEHALKLAENDREEL